MALVRKKRWKNVARGCLKQEQVLITHTHARERERGIVHIYSKTTSLVLVIRIADTG